MSGGKRGSKTGGKKSDDAARQVTAADQMDFKPPLKPHKQLFIGLIVAFAVWVAILVGMYVKTVYGPRHEKSLSSPSDSIR